MRKPGAEPIITRLSDILFIQAIELIHENKMTTAEIASLVGYESEAAFSKAFKKLNGQGHFDELPNFSLQKRGYETRKTH